MKLFQFHELGRLLLKMTPLYKETASNGSGRLPFMTAPSASQWGRGKCHKVAPVKTPGGGGACHKVAPVNTPRIRDTCGSIASQDDELSNKLVNNSHKNYISNNFLAMAIGHSRSRALEILSSQPTPLAMGSSRPWEWPSGVDL